MDSSIIPFQRWRSQHDLDETWLEKVRNAIQDVSLAKSELSEFVQLADLVAGCFRYILENKIPRPMSTGQGKLFELNNPRKLETAQDHLSDFFYRSLLEVSNYEKIDLCNGTYNYHFCIFPFKFKSNHPYETRQTEIVSA